MAARGHSSGQVIAVCMSPYRGSYIRDRTSAMAFPLTDCTVAVGLYTVRTNSRCSLTVSLMQSTNLSRKRAMHYMSHAIIVNEYSQ